MSTARTAAERERRDRIKYVTAALRGLLVGAIADDDLDLGALTSSGPDWIDVERNGRIYRLTVTDAGSVM